MKLLLVSVVLIVAAQIVPSCDGASEVVGWIDEKYIDRSLQGQRYMIVINTVHYDVDFGFWSSVQVGDLVKFDGVKWSIVRKRSSWVVPPVKPWIAVTEAGIIAPREMLPSDADA